MKTIAKASVTLIAVTLALFFASSAEAATKYFDVNTTGNGSGVANNVSYAWSGAYWSASSGGTAATAAWVNGDDAVFSAGTDATGFFKITGIPTAGPQWNSILVEEGAVQLEGNNPTNTGTTGTGGTTLITVNSGCRLSTTNTQGVYMWGKGICKRGPGSLNVGGNQKYVGPTYIEDGTVVTVCELSAKLPFGTGSGANAAIHLVGGTLAFGAPGMTTYPTPTTPGAVYFGSAYTVYLEGGALDMTPQTATFGAYLASNCICQAKITGTNVLTKTGTGIWTLSNSGNDYTNNTVVSAGTLRLGTATSIPNGAGKGIVSLADSAVLDLAGYSQTINGLSGNGTVTNSTGSSTYTLTVGSGDATSAFSGSIKGTGAGTIALTKTGTGTLTLNGANTYTGLSTVNAGTLEGGVSGSIPANVTVGASGVLKLSATSAMSASANLTLAASPAANTVNLNFTGTQTINALYFSTTQKAAGTWGAAGSGANHTNAAFTGTGILSVSSGRSSTTVLTSTANPATYGSLSLTATLTGASGTPTGTITFKEGVNVLGTASLVSGVATLSPVNIPPGGYSLTAEYPGDDNFAPSTNSALSQTVSARPLTIKADDKPKVYGGTVALTFTATGLATGDTVGSATLTCPEAADTAAAAGAYNIIPSDVTGGTFNPANYSISYVNGTLTVSKATLTVTGVEAADKTYDGTTNATLILTNALLAGAVSPDVLTLVTINATGTFTNKTVGVGKTVNVSGLEVAGDRATNYSLIQPATNATIIARTLTVTPAGINKIYDGTTNATVNLSDDKVAGDTVTDSYTLAYFADKVVGNGKPVTVEGIGIGGADVGNYTLASATGSTSADITPRALAVSAAGINKIYDGTTNAAVNLSDDKVAGDTVTDSYTSAHFADKIVANGKLVAVEGIGISGADVGNYTLANVVASTSADITPRSLTVTATGINKAYDGTTNATVNLSDDKVAGDIVIDSYTSAHFADKDVAMAKPVTVEGISIGGADAGNYTLGNTTASTTADITRVGTTTAVLTSTNPVPPGVQITFTANVTANLPSTVIAEGAVQFKVDGSNTGLPKPLVAGSATLDISSLAFGQHTVEAYFTGDNFDPSNGSLTPVQTVNTPPTASDAAYTRSSGMDWRILKATLLTNASAGDVGDTLSLLSVSGATNGTVAIAGDYVTYVPGGADPNQVDQFTYTVQDTLGAQASGTVTLNVASLPATSADEISAVGGVVTIVYKGLVLGLHYAVERAPAADGPFTTVPAYADVTAEGTGKITVTDTPGMEVAFYRLKWLGH